MATYSDTFSGSGALGTLEVGGQTWQAISGTWSRSNGKAVTSTADSSNPCAVVDVGTGDVDVSLNVSSSGGDAIYFRVQDANNWLRLRVDQYGSTSYSYTTQYEWAQQYYPVAGNPSNYSTAYGWGTYDTPPDFSYLNSQGYVLLNNPYKTGATRQVQSGSNTTYYKSAKLEKRVNGGSITNLATYQYAPTTLRVNANGSTITPYINGTAQASVTDSAFSTVVRHGIGRGTSSIAGSSIDNFSISPANVAPNAPQLTGPGEKVTIDGTTVEQFTWQFSDPDPGDSQSAFDLQWWPCDAAWARTGTATTISGGTPNQFYQFAAGYFANGNYEWQVRTYDRLGLAGPWSASGHFAVGTPTVVPTITNPVSGGIIGTDPHLVAWSTAGGQVAYRVRRVADNAGAADANTVYWDSGPVTDANARNLSVPFETNGRYEHVQVSVTSDGQLWSSWADVRVQVSYSPPPAPTFLVDTDTNSGSFLVVVTNPGPGAEQPSASYNEVWVDDGAGFERRATDLPVNAQWRYWTPVALRDYAASVRVTAVGTNGVTSSTTSPLNVTDGNSPANTTTTISDGGVVL